MKQLLTLELKIIQENKCNPSTLFGLAPSNRIINVKRVNIKVGEKMHGLLGK